jgi:hypothetical protein
MKRLLASVLLIGVPLVPSAVEIPDAMDWACPYESAVCSIKRSALVDLIRAKSPQPCGQRES